MLKIAEFEQKYPTYSLTFMANNGRTETEKLVGYRMHILYASYDKKTYQNFTIPTIYYNKLIERLDNLKSDKQWVVMSLNNADFYLQKKGTAVLGFCYQTKERVAVSYPLAVVLTEDEETAFEEQGGDWQG
jgi:hypothetical protein